MLIYINDPDLRVEIIFRRYFSEKRGQQKTGAWGIDFELGDMGTSPLWECLLFYYFFWC